MYLITQSLQAMMGNFVRMMLMGVRQYPAWRANSVMTTLHHWLEQNVLVLMALWLTLITHDALVSASNNYRCQLYLNWPIFTQI